MSTPPRIREDISRMVDETPPSGKHRGIGALPYLYMPHLAGGLALTPMQEGAIGGTLLIGAAIGAVTGGIMSDRWGRRHNITILAVIFLLGALGTTFSPNVFVMYVFRFVLGFAVGAASATVPVYLAENAPKRIRGSIVAIDQLMRHRSAAGVLHERHH